MVSNDISVMWLVSFLLSFIVVEAARVENAHRDFEHDSVKVASVFKSLNMSVVKVLEKAKDYVDEIGEGVYSESNTTCSEALGMLLIRLLEKKIEAVQMIDASSVYQSGLIYGNIWNMGSFDECVKISVNEDRVRFVGQHCFVNLQVSFLTVPLIDPGLIADVGSPGSLWFSICMPSVCKPSSLERGLNVFADEADKMINAHNYSIVFDVDENNCHTSVGKPLGAIEIVGILITFLLLGTAGACTLIDMVFIPNEENGLNKGRFRKMRRYVVTFSMYTNGKRLLDTHVSDNSIQVLHSLKFIAIVWVVVGYHVKMSIFHPLTNLFTALEFISRWTTIVIMNVPLAVDLFFMISGILNTYTYLKLPSRRSFLGHIRSYVHRYLRLTPPYAMMMLVTASWLYRLGGGPMWDIIMGDARNDCRRYWWTGLLYINNYYNPSNNCLFQSWYLAVDMQLFLLSPLVLYCLWRWPKIAFVQILVLVLASIASMFYTAYSNDLKSPLVLNYNIDIEDIQVDVLYMPTHTNAISYIFGILCGYFLYHIKRKKIIIDIHPVLNVVVWLTVVAGVCWSLVGDYSLYQFDTVYNRMNSALIIAFYRFVWCVAMVWIIVVCNTGNGGPLKSFLSMRLWMPLGRLTYCIFLIHASVIEYTVASLKEPQYFGYYILIKDIIGELVLSVILAVILFLTVEAPMLALEKIFLGVENEGTRNPTTKLHEKHEGSEKCWEINLPRALRPSKT